MTTNASNRPLRELMGDVGPEPPSDETLAALAVGGRSQALELLLGRHQRYLFNVALRFLQSRPDAEDATQEVLLRIATRLASFRREAPFRVWAYRIAMNHLLDRARSVAERGVASFDCYADYLVRAEASEPEPELALLVEEAKLTCTLGMLLCFDRRQRLVFILGELFEMSDREGGEILDLAPDHFRQLLSRARSQLTSFMQDRCGLFDPKNPCRCRDKTRAFVRDGIVDPKRLTFRPEILVEARRLSTRIAPDLPARPSVSELLRAPPAFESPDLAARVAASFAWPRPEARGPRPTEES